MFDAVILAVQGVLVPRSSFQHAAIEAAASSLVAAGVPAESFRRAARERLDSCGPSGLVSQVLAGLGFDVPPAARRRAVLAAKGAAPCHEFAPEVREALRALVSRRIVGFFDSGPREVMERLVRGLPLETWLPTRLWAESLGYEARPGRPLPFRWLARRFGVSGQRCLHVALAGPARDAARRAGWQVWPETAPADGPLDLWSLVDWLDTLDEREPGVAWT